MLGHPWISAFAYAGEVEGHLHRERVKQKRTQQSMLQRGAPGCDFTTSAELACEGLSMAASSETPDACQPQTPTDDHALAQRHRGTFMNHTPRSYQVRVSTRLAHGPSSSEDLDRLYASHGRSSDENTNASLSCGGQHSSFGSFTGDQRAKATMDALVEFNRKDVVLNPLNLHPTPSLLLRQHRSQTPSASASIRSSHTGISRRSLRTLLSGNASLGASIHSLQAPLEELGTKAAANKATPRHETANSKRRRRQTPYTIPKPVGTDFGRYAPLEPLVALHRREVTGSDVDPLPPHVDIDDGIDAIATLPAMDEYFGKQGAILPVDQSAEISHRANSSTPQKLPQQGRQPSLSYSPSQEDISAEHYRSSMSSLLDRNPERLIRMNSSVATGNVYCTKSISSLSVQSDFASAAKGQYSPYDERFNTVLRTACRVPAPIAPPPIQSRCASSASGKLAPRIPGNDELANNLNDFNYFLRMTGPSPPHDPKTASKKKRKGLRVMKARSKKEGRKAKEERPPAVPACAREMTTSSGTKHLQIMIPAADVPAAANQAVFVPALDSQGQRTTRVSVVWTDEMLQPLASPPVERAINGISSSPTTTSSPLRSPKPAPVSPDAVPVEDHPLLMSRIEATRSRKLRDLRKAKERGEGGGEERVRRLEWLAGELAVALAVEAGIHGVLKPEEVLGAWRRKRGDV